VFLQNDTGTLDPMTLYATTNDAWKVRIGDFNNDGLADVASIDWGFLSNKEVNVFLQNTGGTLNTPDIYTVIHGGYDDLDVGDINNDGLTDIIVMSGQLLVDNIGVLYQNAGGTFGLPVYYDLGGDELTGGVAVGDANGDGLRDVVVTYGGNRPRSYIGVFPQNATGTLDSPISYPSYDIPRPVVIGYVNGDARQDVIVVHFGWEKIGVYLQESDGSFQAEALYDIPGGVSFNGHGLALGDINGDDKNDVVIAADYNGGLVWLWGAGVQAYSLTIAAGTGGTTNPAPGNYPCDDGIDVSITAVANPNNQFIGWSGDASGTTNPITITMDSDKSIKANFIRQPTLTINAGTGGTTNPAPGTYIGDVGTQVSIRAIPNSGYRFTGWSGDASGTTNPITITMDSDKSITGNFSRTATTDEDETGKKGGCFIATATYGSPLHPYVDTLRDFRDTYLMPNKLGRSLVDLYYKYSPFIADFIAKHKALKVLVRISLFPMVAFSYSMVHFGPIITAVMLAFIFILPIFPISFFWRKLSQLEAKDPKPWLPWIDK